MTPSRASWPRPSHGVPAAQIVARVLPPEQVPAGVARIHQLEVDDVQGIVLLPGVAEALRALRPGRCAIVTQLADVRFTVGVDGVRVVHA